MKTLLILRHAKSSWAEPGVADHDRPLNDRGKRDAPRAGLFLKTQGLTPDLIVSSDAKRARKTAEKVAKHCDYRGDIALSPTLYLAPPSACLAVLHAVDDQHGTVLLVGHNPTLEQLLEQLTGRLESLPTAALAVVDLPLETWCELAPGQGTLRHLWRPKDNETGG